jgi:hypothetical protein
LQIQHLLQTAEACRAAHPDEEWLHLTAFIHGARAAAHCRRALPPRRRATTPRRTLLYQNA